MAAIEGPTVLGEDQRLIEIPTLTVITAGHGLDAKRQLAVADDKQRSSVGQLQRIAGRH